MAHTLPLNTTTESSEQAPSSAEQSRRLAAHAVFVDMTETFDISFVPDLFAELAARPAYLEVAWEVFKQDLDLDRLDGRTKHIIALAITTNDGGTYHIAASPHAFRLNALDHVRCEKILSTIRLFQAFERYLSTSCPSTPKTPRQS
jgi:hypothetical protein